MRAAQLPEADFVDLYRRHGPREMVRRTGLSHRGIEARRRRLELKRGIAIEAPTASPNPAFRALHRVEEHPQRVALGVKDGVVLVGSDAHYWPGEATTAHRGLVRLARELKPKALILNGDVVDGSTVSRHPPIGWEHRPALIEEIEAAQERTAEIMRAAPKARRVWTLGNHDARFETRLATVAPEYARVHGVHLRDHFPDWEPAWSVWINDAVVVKHRFKGGIHATHNNTVQGGKTMVTGHLHSLKVTPWTDYNGTRWGVDTGTLADPDGPQFVDYTEDNPKNWRQGFAVLTFRDGELLWPEVAWVARPGVLGFRDQLLKV